MAYWLSVFSYIFQWTTVSDDLEELLKTAPAQVTDSLNQEVSSKWSSACKSSQEAESKAEEINSLLTEVRLDIHPQVITIKGRIIKSLVSQARNDEGLRVMEVSQSIKKLLTQIRQKRDRLKVLFEGWSTLVTEKRQFKTEWTSIVEESREVI